LPEIPERTCDQELHRERATRIELAFSAWEALRWAAPRCRSGSISAAHAAFLIVHD
jgi:hypothetical protein